MTSASNATIVYCHYAATAPRDCGKVAVQPILDAHGKTVARWTCTFCAEQTTRRIVVANLERK